MTTTDVSVVLAHGGTVMFVGTEVNGGRPDASFTFAHRPEGWNVAWDAAAKRWRRVEWVGTNEPPYRPVDFTPLAAAGVIGALPGLALKLARCRAVKRGRRGRFQQFEGGADVVAQRLEPGPRAFLALRQQIGGGQG